MDFFIIEHIYQSCFRAVATSENPGGHVVLVGDNVPLCPLGEKIFAHPSSSLESEEYMILNQILSIFSIRYRYMGQGF